LPSTGIKFWKYILNGEGYAAGNHGITPLISNYDIAKIKAIV
jgi:hypothetical protein